MADEWFHAIKDQISAGAMARCRLVAGRMTARLHPKQFAFCLDRERHKSLLCPRRSGKTYCLAIYMYMVALATGNANIVFIARTRDKAKEILWEMLKVINKDFEAGSQFSEVHTGLRLPNGSRIRLRGCETLIDVEQYRGEPFHLVVIDEAASFSPGVLRHLIDRGIEPTLGDYLGTLVLSGTPGAVLTGPFYDSTSDAAFEIDSDNVATSRPYDQRDDEKWAGVEFGWSFHTWTRKDNLALPHLWSEAERIRKLNRWSEQNPVWLREYIGRWVADDSNLVYKLDPEKNVWKPGKITESNPFGLPGDHQWIYVLGMDFGTKEPFALQLMAYSNTCPDLYHCWEYVKTGLLPPGFAAAIERISTIVPIERMVGDFGPFGDMLQLTMQMEYGYFIEKAIKKDKRDHIELLNGDFHAGRCFILDGSEALKQMLSLSWDDTGLKERLSREIRNDAADGVAYAWRLVYHHYSEAKTGKSKPDRGTPEYHEVMMAAAEQRAIEADKALRSNPDDRHLDFDAELSQWD